MTKDELREAFKKRLDNINDHYPKAMRIDEIGHYHGDVIMLLINAISEIIDMIPDTPPQAPAVTLPRGTSPQGGLLGQET